MGHPAKSDQAGAAPTAAAPAPGAQQAASAAQRARIVGLIGNLGFAWSNNESVFIHILTSLLGTDFESAVVTFISLNTTRARLDLIRRLAKLRLTDPALLKRLEKLIDRFLDCTKVRNEFNHCVYQFNERGEISETVALRVRENKSGIELIERKPFDEARFAEIERTIKKLTSLNKEIWALTPEIAAAVEAARQEAAASRSSA